jgi:hypothetical protein
VVEKCHPIVAVNKTATKRMGKELDSSLRLPSFGGYGFRTARNGCVYTSLSALNVKFYDLRGLRAQNDGQVQRSVERVLLSSNVLQKWNTCWEMFGFVEN